MPLGSRVQIAVTGSIAMDHLMTFPGRFAESLVVEHLDKISLSFLVEDLQIKRGGIAPNISFGLAALGLNPLLVGSVGEDFGEYRAWLDRHGVLTWPIHISETKHTARFVCTTDADNAQIGSFYTGAMAEARQIELKPIADQGGRAGSGDHLAERPEAMQRHTDECRTRGYRFIADPSQQMAWLDGPDIIRLIDGADFLFCNDYEDTLITQKTGWSHEEIVSRVGVRVMTRGQEGRPGGGRRARSRSTSRSPRRPPSSTRPAWATRSGPASSPGCRGSCRRSGAPSSAACCPAT